MATWQYSIHLVSREELLQDRSKLPKSITEDERERLIGWQASTNLKVVDEIISKYLEKKKSLELLTGLNPYSLLVLLCKLKMGLRK